jgi:hypothetical protein
MLSPGRREFRGARLATKFYWVGRLKRLKHRERQAMVADQADGSSGDILLLRKIGHG